MSARSRSCLGTLLSAVLAVACIWLVTLFSPTFKRQLTQNARGVYASLFPCRTPETYSFGAFDARFNLSKEDFAKAVEEAEAAWETAAGKQLFRRVEADGALTFNLVYDYRQEATDTLRKLGVKIDNDKAGYDRLKAEHDALVADYEAKKKAYDAKVQAHDERIAKYQANVDYWNKHGGAPKTEYERLQAEARAIDNEAHALNEEREAMNAMVDRINANVTVINRLARTVNAAADQYNDVSGERGAEFEEGLFTGVVGSGRIDIFEFDGHDRLVRLLIHEFGHALGMEHVEEEGAIMYRVNSGSSATLLASDVAELKRVCKLD